MNDITMRQTTLDSRDVATMVEKTHANLLKDVRGYIENLAEVSFHSGDFFQETTYLDANNQERPNYLITRKGCEFIAHKMTGQKGTRFTAAYINKFHEMESGQKQPALPTDRLRIQTMNAEARLEYARIRKAELFLKLSNVDTLSTEYKGILVAQATEVLAGQPLLPPVPSVQKTHSATDLAEMFSTTAAMIGRITNAKGLKTEEYGENYRAKSRYSTKEVDTFRYYDTIIPVLEKFFSKQPALTTV